MSIFSKIGGAIKSVAKKAVTAVKKAASSVTKSNLGATAVSAVKKVVSSGGSPLKAGVNAVGSAATKAVVNKAKTTNWNSVANKVVPGYAAATNKSYYSSGSSRDPQAYNPSTISASAQKLVSPNVSNSFNATNLTGGVGSSELGGEITPFEIPSYIQSDMGAGLTGYLGASAINSGSNMGMSGSTVGAGMTGGDSSMGGIDNQTDEEKQVKENQQALIDMMNELAGVPKEKYKLEKQAGLPQMNAELSDLQAKQTMQTAQYMSQMQDIQNKPIALEFIAGQQGEVQRRAGIDAMITSALIQSKQGQIQTAQNTIDQAINLKYDTLNKRIDTQKAILEMNYENLSRSDKKLADERRAELDAQKADLTQFKGIQTEAAKQAMASGDSTAFQAIMNATSYEELSKAGGQYAPAGTFADFSTFTSTLTPTQQQNFANIPDDLKTSVQELVNGDVLISDLVKSRGIQGTQQIQKLINYAQSVDPTYSVNTEKQRYAFKQKWVNDAVQGSVGSRTAINTALGHLADLSEASKQLPGGVLKKMNSVKNVLSKEFGDPSVTNFRITLEALGSELARVYKGGVPNEGEIKAWQESLAANFAKSQLKGAFNTTAKLLSSKITGLRYTYKTAMGKEYDQTVIDPDKRQALINAGINPNAIISENLPKATAGVISVGGFAEAW